MAAWGRLRVLDGAHEGTVFVLEREVHTLGRGQASDFRLADPTVSRVQAELRSTPEGMRISGLSDKNPVWVNGEPAGRGRPIAFGDKVQCGLVHLVFEDLPPPAPPGTEGPPATSGLAMTTSGVSAMENIPAAPAAPGPGGAIPAVPRGPACGRCGAKEAPGARFCGSCGGALSGSVPLPATSVTRVPAQEPAPASQSISPLAPTPMAPMRAETHREDLPPLPVRTDTMSRPPEALDGIDAPLASHRGAPPPAPGSVLKGRFELRRHIAHGRVTEVYEGLDRETKTPVTVKVLLPSLAGDLDVRDWFFHAANALIVAPHPCLLRVHSVHEAGQTCFAVTDLLSGVPLRDQIRSRPPSMGGFEPEEVRRVGTALCEGLARLHEVGPHGDVVPGNVWVDPQGRVTLLDAGLSAIPGKAVRWPPTSDLASAVYSAPEVLRGAPPTACSDLYSVGAILYHMLTAELPAGRIPSVQRARPGLPPDLAGAVDRAMSPRPEERFSSAQEMVAFLTGEIETRRRTGLRKRYIAAAAAAVLLAVGGSSVFWFPPAMAWRRRSFVDPAAVARADLVRGEFLEEQASLAALSDFTSAPILERAREAFRRGEAARGDSLPEEAEGEFARALLDLKREKANALEAKAKREELRAKAEARALELENEIAHVGSAGAFLGLAEEEFLRRAAAAIPSAEPDTVLAAVEVLERRSALGEAGRKAGDLQMRWTEFSSAGEAVRRARRDLADSRALLEEGKAAKAETLARDGILRLRRAMGEEMESLLVGLCTEANVARPREFEEAKSALGEAIFSGTKEDADGAAAAFDHALTAFAGIVGKALEGVRVSVEAREAAKRCTDCTGAGMCAACGGIGSGEAKCGTCEGRGLVPGKCPECDGSTRVHCGKCAGSGEVSDSCPECSGQKWILCPDCRGAPKKCDFKDSLGKVCDQGTITCFKCRGSGQETVAGDKKKPCTLSGCVKGRIPCRNCGGDGIVDCPTCHGDPHPACKACGGTGGTQKTCPKCGGSKKQDCGQCSGTGKVDGACPAGCTGGKVVSTCQACAGKKKCRTCDGRGRKE